MKRILLLAATAALAFAGCSTDDPTGNDRVSDVVHFSAEPVTRGTPVTNENAHTYLTDLGVFGYYTGQSNWSEGALPDKMYDRKLLRSGSTWVYDGVPVEWNANKATDLFTFFAYAPYATGIWDAGTNAGGNGIVVNGSASTPGVPTITYTVPQDVEKQPDLMVAVPRKDIFKPIDGFVSLRLEHALTTVGFQVAGNGEKIAGISVSGISITGTLAVDGSDILWSDLGGVVTATDFSASINTDPGEDYYTAQPSSSPNLMKGNGYLMMVPQALGPDAKVTITLVGGDTRTINLGAHVWLPGKRVVYNITILPNGTIGIGPDVLTLPWFGINHETDNISVLCTDENDNPAPNMPWTLTSTNPEWFMLTLNPDGSGAGATVSGTGSQTVYTVATANNSTTANRTTTVYLNGAPDNAVVHVVQLKKINLDEIPGGTLLAHSFVGAFWRNDQTGERVITVNLPAGDWSATVEWMDDNWNDGDIILASGGSEDPNIYTSNPGNAESYKVQGNATAISGTLLSDGGLTFRIGLNPAAIYTPTTTNPARYAVVVVSYAGYTSHHKIFLRQGERPDEIVPGSGIKWVPFNMTLATGATTSGTGTTLTSANAGLTAYPSQAGYYFKWSHPNAIYPTGALSGWSNTYNGSYTLANDPCQRVSTFHRTPAVGGGTLTVGKWGLGNVDFTSWGYYADGWFDRGQILKSSTVGTGAQVAYRGLLFFGSNNASMFLPAIGMRDSGTAGSLTDVDAWGYYWSGSMSNLEGAHLSFTRGYINPNTLYSRSTGMSVRCISTN